MSASWLTYWLRHAKGLRHGDGDYQQTWEAISQKAGAFALNIARGLRHPNPEEFAYDAVVRVFLKVETFKPWLGKGNSKLWVRVLVRRMWIDQIRKVTRGSLRPANLPADTHQQFLNTIPDLSVSPEDELMDREAEEAFRKELREAEQQLQTTHPGWFKVYQLFDRDGLSGVEVHARLRQEGVHLAQSTVYQWLLKAHEFLRELLASWEGL